MTYTDEVGNIGVGNVVGKHSMVAGISMTCNFNFKPNRVQMTSSGVVHWMFDVGK